MITSFYKLLSFLVLGVTLTLVLPPLSSQSADINVVENTMSNFTIKTSPTLVPELNFLNEQGVSLSLKEFRNKVLLVNLWATWCAPCRHEMPALDALQGDLGSSEFQVVAISTDRRGREVVRDFYDKLGIENLAIYNDKTMKAPLALRVRGLPTTLLIDRKGREIGRLVGPARWDSKEAKELIGNYIMPNTACCQ